MKNTTCLKFSNNFVKNLNLTLTNTNKTTPWMNICILLGQKVTLNILP